MGSGRQLKTNSHADPASEASAQQSSGGNAIPQQKTRISTWPSLPGGPKAAAVTEVARESISVTGNASSESLSSSKTSPSASPKGFRSRSIQLTKKAGASSRSLPADVTTTKVNVASNGLESTNSEISKAGDAIEQQQEEQSATGAVESCPEVVKTKESPDQKAQEASVESPSVEKRESQSSWFGWLGWRGSSEQPREKDMDGKSPDDCLDKPTGEQQEVGRADDQKANNQPAAVTETADSAPAVPTPAKDAKASTSQKRSWIQIWGNSASSPKPENEGKKSESAKECRVETEESAVEATSQPATQEASQPEAPAPVQETLSSETRARSSSWSLWPMRIVKSERPEQKQRESSETRISSSTDLPSQAGHEPSLQQQQAQSQKKDSKSKTVTKSTPDASAVGTSREDTPSPRPPKDKKTEYPTSKQLHGIATNRVLPSFRDTFALQESPSWLKTIARYLYYTKEPENKHVYVTRDPPRPKRALAIGVHGYFPAPYLRTVLGQPTGTSVKFSNMAAKAIHTWAENHGYQCQVEKISLEGEGKIAERVDILWKLLLNWMDDIRQADFIMFACHSQGVPVTVMLVAKLISFGCINATRVGICGMAGVNLGPCQDYKSRWIGGSAGELFDFALPSSKVSQDYEAALKAVLDFGVRITYVGSLDDQLVSLESSLFAPVFHPYIYRAVFVDERVHPPSFLSHLVGFTLKLRNLGISDHGLIRELSAPLVGSLVGGEGHSRLHDEEGIYYLATEFALETTNTPSKIPVNIKRSTKQSNSSSNNPYILPFAMRGLLEEDYVRRELRDESISLLKLFDEWQPTTKVLKDVKFRLEGVRSKL